MSDEALAEAEGEDNPNEEPEAAEEIVEPELDEDGNPVPQEPEDEEVELGDLKLKVPKTEAQKLKDGWLRQEDYTRKTQALADEKTAFAAERSASQQAGEAETQAHAQVLAFDAQLAEYQNIDWDTWIGRAQANLRQATNAFDSQGQADAQAELAEIQATQMRYSRLKDARANAANQFVGLRQQRGLETQQSIAKRVEETRTALAKDIPGWSEAVEAQVADFGIKGYGFTREEMADMKVDPRIAKAFHRLHTLEEAAKKNTKATATAKIQEIKPAAKAGGGSAPATGLSDNLSNEEWQRRRNAQVRKKA